MKSDNLTPVKIKELPVIRTIRHHKKKWRNRRARARQDSLDKLVPINAPAVAAYKLLHPLRMDVCAKHAFARLHAQFTNSGWAKEVYEQHILVMNGGHEAWPEKNGIQEYFDHFQAILDSIKHDGWRASEAIPVLQYDHHLISNGAHRTAACLFNDIEPATRINQKADWLPCYSYSWFKSHGLRDEILDFMLLEYLQLRPDCFVCTVWPKAINFIEVIRQHLAEHCTIVCLKKFNLSSENALTNIVRQVYFGESWLGSSANNFCGAHSKAKACWDDSATCYIIVLQSDSLDAVKVAKQHARVACGLKNSALHITDNRMEALRVGRIFFNTNSVSLVNNAILNESPQFANRIIKYCNAVGLDESYAIHGSSVMEALGIRHANDLDYVSATNTPLKTDKGISMDNEKATYTGHSLVELTLDPRNYFYYCGAKFVNLDIVRKMKAVRNEQKDQVDIKLIENFYTDSDERRQKG